MKFGNWRRDRRRILAEAETEAGAEDRRVSPEPAAFGPERPRVDSSATCWATAGP